MGEAEISKALNDLARHRMIMRLLADIRIDIEVCRIEGWDVKEYIRMLQTEINRLGEREINGKEGIKNRHAPDGDPEDDLVDVW